MPLHTGTLYRFVPAVQTPGSISEPEWVKQHCILDSNSNLRFYADKQRTGGSTMKKIDMLRHYADVELQPQFGRDHVFVIRPFAIIQNATSPPTRVGGGVREDSRSLSQRHAGSAHSSNQLAAATPPLSPLRPTSPAILPIVAVSLQQAGGDDTDGSSRPYRSRSSAPDGVMLAAKNETDKRAWISIFREVQQAIGKDDGDSDTDSVRSANPMYVLVGDPPSTTKYDDSGDEREDEDDDSDATDRRVSPVRRDDDAQRKRRRKRGAASVSVANVANPDGSPFSSRSVPQRGTRSLQSSPRNSRTVPSSKAGGASRKANGLSPSQPRQSSASHLATSRAPVTRSHTAGSGNNSLTRPKSTSISARLRRGFSRGGALDSSAAAAAAAAENGLSAPMRAAMDREREHSKSAASLGHSNKSSLTSDPFAALTATKPSRAAAAQGATIDTSVKQRRSSRSCPATPMSFEENGAYTDKLSSKQAAKRSNSSTLEFTNGDTIPEITTSPVYDIDEDNANDDAVVAAAAAAAAATSRVSSTSIEAVRRWSPSNPGTPRSRTTKQRSQFVGNSSSSSSSIVAQRGRSGTSHVSSRRASFRRGPRNKKAKSLAARRRSTSSSNISIPARNRASSREQLNNVKRSSTTPAEDLEVDIDTSDENLDNSDSPQQPTDLHSILFGSKYDLFATQDGGTTAQSDVPIMNDVPADLEIPREQIEKFLSWSTERAEGKSSRHVKKAVSKKKRRFVADGFDLDLTYITDRIVAMGFPSENLEAVYRNDMKETQLFFNTRHTEHYMIYNLCSERDYDHAKFDNRVVAFPFDDHNCPPFDDMEPFCDKMDEWLCADEQNVAALHCKAGKGRTGLMICVYLIHTGMWKTAAQSLNFYGVARTYNQKGVTIPSQRRWVWYFEKYCQMRDNGVQRPLSRPLIITKIFVSETAPVFHSFNVKNKVLDKKYSSKRLRHKKSGNDQSCVLNCGSSMVVHKDVRVEFVKFSFGGGVKNRVFSFWFHTDFIENNRLRLEKADIDKVNKDKKMPEFWVEVFFEDYQPAEVEELKVGNLSPSLSHNRDDPHNNMMERKLSNISDASMMNDEELVSLGKQMKRSLPVKNRSWKLKVFRDVFCGREAVQWLIEHAVATQDDAVVVGQQMLELGVFHFVRSEKASVDEFQNSSQFYRFGRNKARQRADTADAIAEDDVPVHPALARATSSPLSARSPTSSASNASPNARRVSSIQRSSAAAAASSSSSASASSPNSRVVSTNVNVVTSSHGDGNAEKQLQQQRERSLKRNSSTPRHRGKERSGADKPLLSGGAEMDFTPIHEGNELQLPPRGSVEPATDTEDEGSPSHSRSNTADD